jgi:hypothetical protein
MYNPMAGIYGEVASLRKISGNAYEKSGSGEQVIVSKWEIDGGLTVYIKKG